MSSPGIDRPLTRLQDFADWQGYDARIKLSPPIATEAGDRKQIDGRLNGLEGDTITVYAERVGEIAIPFAQVASAKLLLTDALIKATAPLSSAGADKIIEVAPTEGADRISQEG